MRVLDGFLFNKTENTYAKDFKQRLGVATISNP